MNNTIISKCTCEHEYQDKIYGKGMRVFNHASKGDKQSRRYRCTVCNKEKDI